MLLSEFAGFNVAVLKAATNTTANSNTTHTTTITTVKTTAGRHCHNRKHYQHCHRHHRLWRHNALAAGSVSTFHRPSTAVPHEVPQTGARRHIKRAGGTR